MVVGTVGLLAVKSDVDTTRDGVYAATRSTAQARIAGFDAKSNESLTLIARGSGAAFEKAWQASSAAVTAQLTELGQNPASSGLEPAAVVGLRRGRTSRSARSTTAGTGTGAVALATGRSPTRATPPSPRSTPAPTSSWPP